MQYLFNTTTCFSNSRTLRCGSGGRKGLNGFSFLDSGLVGLFCSAGAQRMEYLSMTQGEYLNAIFRHDFVGAVGEEEVFVFWVNQERRR